MWFRLWWFSALYCELFISFYLVFFLPLAQLLVLTLRDDNWENNKNVSTRTHDSEPWLMYLTLNVREFRYQPFPHDGPSLSCDLRHLGNFKRPPSVRSGEVLGNLWMETECVSAEKERAVRHVIPTHPPQRHTSAGSSPLCLDTKTFFFPSRWVSWVCYTSGASLDTWRKKTKQTKKKKKPQTAALTSIQSLLPKVKCCQKYLHADLFKYAAKTAPVVEARAPLSSSRLLTRAMPLFYPDWTSGDDSKLESIYSEGGDQKKRTARFLRYHKTIWK